MSLLDRNRVIIASVCVIAAAVAGCASRSPRPEPVEVVSGGNVGVIPFEDHTGEAVASLGVRVAHQFAARLSLSEFEVIDPIQMEALLAEAGLRPSAVPDGDVLKRIGEATGCDLLVVGNITAYKEGGRLLERARASVSIRLLETSGGSVVYSRGVTRPETTGLISSASAEELALACADRLADLMSRDVVIEGDLTAWR